MPLDPMLSDWKAAKTEFEKTTGKKKPSEKFFGVFRKSSGVEDDLKSMDAVTTKVIKDDKQIETLRKSFASFKKTSVAYQKMLKDAVDKEAEKNDLTRGLKMLSARLDRYEASVGLLIEEGVPDSSGSADPKEIAAAMAAGAVKLAAPATRKGLVLCAAAIKAIKLSPTPETWKKEMQPAARGLTTGLRNYKMADKSATHADGHIKDLTPYASGNLADLPADSDAARVQGELAKFTTIVKTVAAQYPDGKYDG